MIEYILLAIFGAALGFYVYTSFFGGTVIGFTASGLIGGATTTIAGYYGGLIYWLMDGLTFQNMWSALFLIGYVLFAVVLLFNLLATTLDDQPGITAVR